MKNRDNQVLKELQKVELDILKEFIRVCDKLNLKYYLASGTCLGAVRHQGFIPWDDDIDVSMTRRDYEVFLKKAPKIINKKYFIQNYESDSEFPQSYGKIRNSKTTFMETTAKNLNMNHGIYIDIFILDYYNPSKKINNFINYVKIKLLDIKIYNYFYTSNKKSIKHKIGEAISNIFYKKCNLNELIKKKDLISKKSCRKSKYYKYYNDFVFKRCFPIEMFGEGVFLKFEDINARVPKDYDTYLKLLYNDYMKLPPENERKPHHYNEVIDVNKSYKEYMK